MKDIFNKWGKHVAAIIIFLVLVTVYFSPAVLDGKSVRQSDMEKASGVGYSQMEQYAKTAEPGEFSAWSDAMFSGMPYITGYGNPAPELPGYKLIEKPVKSIGPLDAGMVFAGLVCFYILMCVMGVNWWLALAGAFAFAFATYNIIIIMAGHITKAYVIAYMPIVLAGMALLFRKRYLWGAVLFLLGVALSISNGHIQITYYLVLVCLFIYLGYLVWQIRQKGFKELGIVTAIMVGCVIMAVLPNAKEMYAQWDLGQHSTRGPTELTTTTAEGEKISSGLDKDYAFQWSYGKMELLSVLIPNAYGGVSRQFDTDSEVYKAIMSNLQNRKVSEQDANTLYRQSLEYWGSKPFTQGGFYFGALVCFLFVLGMFTIRNQMKWWLFAGALLLTLIAFGKNLDAFNTFLFHNLPLFNKFRTVEMALALPGLIVPIIAIWGLKDLFTEQIDTKVFKRGMIGALAITGGLCLIVWLMPTVLLDFRAPHEAQANLPDWYYHALILDRQSLASSDALRSLIFVLLGAGLVFWYFKAKNKVRTATFVSIGIAILILADLWAVDKRYLNESNFIREKPSEVYKPTVVDNEISKDKDPSFRVLNLNNPFEETTTSYFHHSLGGYHAAKLRRYQELIEHRFSKELNTIYGSFQGATSENDILRAFTQTPSLNMLNARYIIYHPEQPPLRNPFAFGNAWFVQQVEMAENADAEIAALNTINPLTTAVVDKRFADDVTGFTPSADSTATIILEKYRPNKLTYSSKTASEQLAVFSEIYYQPGWNAYIDGKPAPHFRADWTLRAMRIPAGEHQIVFEFYPEMYVTTAYIESISSFLILLLLIAAIGYSGWRYWKG